MFVLWAKGNSQVKVILNLISIEILWEHEMDQLIVYFLNLIYWYIYMEHPAITIEKETAFFTFVDKVQYVILGDKYNTTICLSVVTKALCSSFSSSTPLSSFVQENTRDTDWVPSVSLKHMRLIYTNARHHACPECALYGSVADAAIYWYRFCAICILRLPHKWKYLPYQNIPSLISMHL